MSEFTKFDKTRLTNALHVEFMFLFKEKLSATDPAGNEELANFFSAFSEAYDEENRCYKVSQGSDLTPTINQIDDDRDHVYSCFRNIVNAWANNSVHAEEQASALKLRSVINLYKIDNNQQKDEQTSRIRNLIEDLQNAEMQPHLTKLHLEALVLTLEDKNLEFASLIEQRNTENSLKQKGALRQARLNIDAIYDELLDYIEAAERFTHAVAYTNFIDSWNNTINYYVNILDRKSYNYSDNNDDNNNQDDNNEDETDDQNGNGGTTLVDDQIVTDLDNGTVVFDGNNQ